MELLKHSALLELPQEEQQPALLKNHEEFREYVSTLSDDDKALKEDEIIKALNEYDEVLKNQVYTLPSEVKFDGTVYKLEQVHKHIIDFLESIEVEWQQALLIYEAIKYVKLNKTEISYPVFDNITRLLGSLKFKGHHQTRNILVVNELFTPVYTEYARDRMYLGYLSMCHNETIPGTTEQIND